MAETRNGYYIDRLKQLDGQRKNWETQWLDITEYLLPEAGYYSNRGQQPSYGEERHEKIFDATGTRALRVLAAGMQGGLTSPARPWFRLVLTDKDLMEWGPVKNWLHDTESRMYRAFAKTNFYSAIHIVYEELGGFGTGVMFEREYWNRNDRAFDINFRAMTAGECYLASNDINQIDTLYRIIPMTAKQIVERFGEGNASQAVQRALKDKLFQFFDVVHVVEPRKVRNLTRIDAANMPWKSVYFEKGEDTKRLQEKGFEEFPYMCPRWKARAADVYGRGPGMDILADVKTLQEIRKAILKADQLGVDPPLLIPDKYKGKVKMYPGGLTYAAAEDMEKITELFKLGIDFGITFEDLKDLRMAIREGLYNDLFLMILERPNMTATEVAERHEEKLLMLGPVIERQENELLEPVIDRTFSLLAKQQRLSSPPPDLVAAVQQDPEVGDIKVEFISLMAQAQKLLATRSIDAMMDFAARNAPARPEMLDKIDYDAAVEEYGDQVGAPPRLIVPDDKVQKMREARQAAQETAAQMQAVQAGIQGAKDLSQTKTDEDTALGQLTRAIQGGRI